MDRCGQRCAPGCAACQEVVALHPIWSYPLPGPRIEGRCQADTQDQVAPLENVLAPEPSETEAGGTDGVQPRWQGWPRQGSWLECHHRWPPRRRRLQVLQGQDERQGQEDHIRGTLDEGLVLCDWTNTFWRNSSSAGIFGVFFSHWDINHFETDVSFLYKMFFFSLHVFYFRCHGHGLQINIFSKFLFWMGWLNCIYVWVGGWVPNSILNPNFGLNI